jgi:hypothetical protein
MKTNRNPSVKGVNIWSYQPPHPPLPQVVVHMCGANVNITVLHERLGHKSKMDFLEAIVSLDGTLDQRTS